MGETYEASTVSVALILVWATPPWGAALTQCVGVLKVVILVSIGSGGRPVDPVREE